MPTPRAIDLLADLLSQPEGAWSLADGALAVAHVETPDCDVEMARSQLEALGKAARNQLGDATHPRFAAAAVSRVLFLEKGYRGCTDAEEAPDMAMLDVMLRTRVGTPNLLSILFVETARRAGLRFSGVSLPGRYLLRQDHGDQFFLFDPQAGGKPVSIEQCKELVSSATGRRIEFREAFLRPLTNAQMLARLVAHLKSIYWRAGAHERALLTVRMLLTIRPDDPREIRDQGRLYYLMGRLPEAISAFESYLHHNPRGEDAEAVRVLLLEARASLGP
ncbi:MAG: tetratricopeptide repeat protein [Acidobacteriota bacterium]